MPSIYFEKQIKIKHSEKLIGNHWLEKSRAKGE